MCRVGTPASGELAGLERCAGTSRAKWRRTNSTVTYSHIPDKSMLVDLGLACLARGQWAMVRTITQLIQARGWRHV